MKKLKCVYQLDSEDDSFSDEKDYEEPEEEPDYDDLE